MSASDAVFVDNCPACGYGTAPIEVAGDGGAKLAKRRRRQPQSAFGASFVSTYDGWVVGDDWRTTSVGTTTDTRIEHTSDGGRSWATQYSAPEGNGG